MSSGLPRLRRDLTFSTQETASGTACIVKDPDSHQFFRLAQAEYFIALQLDGETPLEVVRQRAEERFGEALDPATLTAFIKHLEKAGLLDASQARKRPHDPGRVRGSLLYLRFKLFDPARLFEYLAPRVQFCFTSRFVALSAALILLAGVVTIANWTAYTEDVSRLYRVSAIPLFLVVICLVSIAHEFGHGLTCNHFGGEVHEIGFMLIYFSPAFYCDVSDAWLFPEKAKRLWVDFAGAFVDLVLWALATLAWRLTDVETSTNYLALMVMTTFGVKTLFNFNPLIKLDGYYLLSDYLDIPNLRRKSFRYVGALTERLFGLGPATVKTISRRERRIYLTYGLVATICSSVFLMYVLVTAGGFFIERGQPLILLLLLGFVGMKSRRRFRNLFGGSSDSADDGDSFETASVQEPPEPEAHRKRHRRRARKRWTVRIAWAAVMGTLVATAFLGRMQLRVAGQFNVRPQDNADVRTAVEGIIEAIYVDEGDQVTAGEPVARLSDRDLRAELLKTEAEMREARAQFELVKAGPTAEEIEVAKAAVATGKDQLAYARSRFARFQTLFERGLVSRKEFEDQQELVATSVNALAEATAKLGALLASVRPEQIEAVRAQLERLGAHRRYLEDQLRLLTVVSPATGIVATPSRELKHLLGQLVKKGDLVARVYDFNTVTVYIAVSEKEIADIEVGQTVVLRARAYPDVDFHGAVTSVATSAQGGEGTSEQILVGAPPPGTVSHSNRTILVTTQIDNRSLLLKPEMTGQAKILCGERRIIDLLTRRLARTVKVEFWSWW